MITTEPLPQKSDCPDPLVFPQAAQDYEKLFYLAPDASLITDCRGRISTVNRAAAILFGRSPGSLAGQSIVSLVRWGERTAFRNRLQRLKQFGTITDWEATFHPTPAPPFVGALSAVILPPGTGDGGRIFWSLRDITERKSAEVSLSGTMEGYRHICERIPDILYATDTSGKVISIAGATEQLLNRRPETLIGENLLDLGGTLEISRAVLHQIADEIAGCIARKGSTVEHRVHLDVNGTSRVFELKETIRYDDRGAFQGLSGVLRDMTHQRDHDPDVRILVDNCPNGIVVLQDYPFRVAFANPALATMLGYPRESLLSFSPDDLLDRIHPEDREEVLCRYKNRLLWQPDSPRCECRFRASDGSWKWLEIFPNLIEYRGRKAVMAVCTDITDKKCADIRHEATRQVWRVVLEDLQVGIFITTPDPMNRFLFVNPILSFRLGYETPAELMAVPVPAIYRNQLVRERILAKLREEGKITNEGVEMQRKDGSGIMVSISAIAVRNEADDIVWIEGIIEEAGHAPAGLEKYPFRACASCRLGE